MNDKNKKNPNLDIYKSRLAAQKPNRPGENCQADEGIYIPVINRNRCEGKADCSVVCPYDVFEIRKMDEEDFKKLSFVGKMKSRAHGKMTAYTPHADLCKACGLCVVACPERAITLVKTV